MLILLMSNYNTFKMQIIKETDFQKSYKEGILSKDLFEKSNVTNDFIAWVTPFIDGRNTLKNLNLDYNGKYNSLNDAIDKYQWREDDSFEATYEKYTEWRKILKSGNDEDILDACLEILKWGGVVNKNEEKVKRRKNLNLFLTQMNSLIGQEEIIIDDLNPKHISSGFTKIYAALNEEYIIYDGRVGAALCYLIRCYLEQIGVKKLPAELLFGWGVGRGNNERDPKNKTIKFPEITQNRTVHFISNIKANWLLSLIADNNSVAVSKANNRPKRIFALQSALFVLGQELPSTRNIKPR